MHAAAEDTDAIMAQCRRLRSEMGEMDRAHLLRGLRRLNAATETLWHDVPVEWRDLLAPVLYAVQDGIRELDTGNGR